MENKSNKELEKQIDQILEKHKKLFKALSKLD